MMKKRLLAIVLVGVLALATACGEESTNLTDSLKDTIKSAVEEGINAAKDNGNSNDTAKDTEPTVAPEESAEPAAEPEESTEPAPEPTEEAEEEVDEAEEDDDAADVVAFKKNGSLGDLTIKVRKAKVAKKFRGGLFVFSSKKKGNVLLKVDLSVKNNGDEKIKLFPFIYNPSEDIIAKVVNDDGDEFESLKMIGFSDDMHDRTVKSGKTEKGALIFELSKKAGKKLKNLKMNLSMGEEELDFELK